MNLIVVLVLSAMFLVSCQHPKTVAPGELRTPANQKVSVEDQLAEQYCPTVKEYVTTFEYLKSKKQYYRQDWAQSISEKVSKGYKGAALRFIKVFELLVKTDAYAEDAANLAIEMALTTDEMADSFLVVFQKAYLKNYLDLDLANSIKLARGLTLEYKGMVKNAAQDYEKLVRYCTSQKNLDLAKPVCADMAYRMVRYGQETPTGIYDSFVAAFEFLTSSKGPNVSTSQALQISEELIKVSPMASYNFIKAYQYGIDQKGMGLPVAKAVEFAQVMGSESIRLPASEIKTQDATASPK